MQNSLDPLSGSNTGTLPPLSNGKASEASHHGLVVNATLGPHSLWLDLGIALVVAVAAPLLLKKILETEFAARLFRAPPPNTRASASTAAEEEFDFDA